jgi:hypothetical protein
MLPSVIVTGGLILLRCRDKAVMAAGCLRLAAGSAGFPATEVHMIADPRLLGEALPYCEVRYAF